MGEVISTFGLILRASVRFKFYFYMLLLFILTMVLGLLSAVVMIIGGGIIFLVGLMLYAFLSFSLPGLIIYAILFLFFLLIVFFVGAFVDAVIEGLGINLCWDFLSGKKLDLNAAFKRLQPRLFDATKLRFYVWLIIGLVVLVLLAIPFLLFVPAINFADLAFMDFEDFILPIAGSIIFLALMFLLIFLAAFFLMPFFVILFQLPFFEKKSPRECVDRAIALGKKNYWRNMGFYLLMVVTLMIVFTFVGIFSFTTGILGAVMESEALMAISIMLFLIMSFVMFFVRVFIQAWAVGLGVLFQTAVYFLNTGKKVTKPKDVKLKF